MQCRHIYEVNHFCIDFQIHRVNENGDGVDRYADLIIVFSEKRAVLNGQPESINYKPKSDHRSNCDTK